MTMPIYVHIVESPSPDDLSDGITEGGMLRSMLNLAGIPCEYHIAVDRVRFDRAIGERLVAGVEAARAIPILHISAHGGPSGIQLTNQRDAGEVIGWDELAKQLAPVRRRFQFLGLCLSTCSGLFGHCMAQVISANDMPMDWIVGSSETESYVDLALAFSLFYRGFQKFDRKDDVLFDGIRKATGLANFGIINGHSVQKEFFSVTLKELMQSLPPPNPLPTYPFPPLASAYLQPKIPSK